MFVYTYRWLKYIVYKKTTPHYSSGVLWYQVGCPCVCPSVRLSYVRPYFRFRMITSKCRWIFTKRGVCIDIVEIWFGIVNGQFRQFLTELSARDMSEFSFLDDKLSKCQWIFSKLGVCLDIMKIWFAKFHQF